MWQEEKMPRTERKKSAGRTLIAVGAVLLLAALALTLYNRWDARRADRAAQATVGRLEDELPDTPSIYPRQLDTMPTVEIDGERYIGILTIPELGLKLPVMDDWDYEKLTISPCRYAGSYLTDDLVIAAHNYDRHFSPIKWISPNTDVYFTNVEGTVYHYIVDNVETLQPTQVEQMITGDWALTMFTCHTGGRTRCAVRCIKAEGQW